MHEQASAREAVAWPTTRYTNVLRAADLRTYT